MARKKKPKAGAEPIPLALSEITQEQKRQLVDIYRTFRKHFSEQINKGKKKGKPAR